MVLKRNIFFQFVGQAERDEGRVEDDPVVPIRDEEAHEFEDLGELTFSVGWFECQLNETKVELNSSTLMIS